MIGVMLLVLFVLLIGLLLFCIRKGKGGPEKPRRGRSSTADSSTKILDSSDTSPPNSEAVPKAVTTPPGIHPTLYSKSKVGIMEGETDNVITHLKDYQPLSNASTLQYTVFGFSPPASSTPNSSPSTQSDAAAAPSRATPCNTPQHDVNPIKRRGIGYTESGRSISPRRTVETISARLEEAEHAQNGVSDR
ncbi:hypothetical protein MMC07_006734 [Pseudocyphellaria aurata]|nr:hypothetical protein [Pseudocyphellaria aurata]